MSTQLKKILKMMDQFSLQDDKFLDEIDVRVWCWLNGYKFKKLSMRRKPFGKENELGAYLEFNHDDWAWVSKLGMKKNDLYKYASYTRSRDALKMIIPEGWGWVITVDSTPVCQAFKDFPKFKRQAHICYPSYSEEMSELMCILIAIDTERKND